MQHALNLRTRTRPHRATRTAPPRSSPIHRARAGFTLVEILIVVAIIALLAATAVPNFIRARKRAQAILILEELRTLDAALTQYAVETNKQPGDRVNWEDLKPYLKPGTRLHGSNGLDSHGHEMLEFVSHVIVSAPHEMRLCSDTFAALSDVAPAEFWSPYGIH